MELESQTTLFQELPLQGCIFRTVFHQSSLSYQHKSPHFVFAVEKKKFQKFHFKRTLLVFFFTRFFCYGTIFRK